ncbi:hypothetical protein EsH8_XIII_000020 [Colletotrichum jinshuiense]
MNPRVASASLSPEPPEPPASAPVPPTVNSSIKTSVPSTASKNTKADASLLLPNSSNDGALPGCVPPLAVHKGSPVLNRSPPAPLAPPVIAQDEAPDDNPILAKRQRSPSPDASAPAPKHPCPPRTQRRDPLPQSLPGIGQAPYGFTIESLGPGRYVEGTVILHILRTIAALCPLSVEVLDPLVLKGEPLPRRLQDCLASKPDAVVIAPVNLTGPPKHWVLAVASGNVMHISDSMPAATNDEEVMERLKGLKSCLESRRGRGEPEPPGADGFKVVKRRCPSQGPTVDCGVAVIVNGIYVIAGLETPDAAVDYGVWRRVLAAFCSDRPAGPFLPEGWDEVAVSALDMPEPPSPLPGQITAAKYRRWKKRQAMYQQQVAQAVRDQAVEKRSNFLRLKDTIEGAADTWASLQLVGTGPWQPRLTSRRRIEDFADELQVESFKCDSAAKVLSSCQITDTETVEKLRARLRHLKELQGRRKTILSAVGRLAAVLAEEWTKVDSATKDVFGDWDIDDDDDDDQEAKD